MLQARFINNQLQISLSHQTRIKIKDKFTIQLEDYQSQTKTILKRGLVKIQLKCPKSSKINNCKLAINS